MEEMFQEIDEAIQKTPSEDLASEQLALSGVRTVAGELRQLSESILEKRDEYVHNSKRNCEDPRR